MKECFICFESIFHGVKFGCKHEICIYCFMKLECNLCPYCRFPMYELKIIHYSTHIPPFLKEICKSDDPFSYILLQIYHSNPRLINLYLLIRDIKKWSIPYKIKRIYINEIMGFYKFIHPEKKQILILLFNILFLSFITRNDIYFVRFNPQYPNVQTYIEIYPLFIIFSCCFILYSLYYLYEYKKLTTFNFKEREKIKIENFMII